MSKIDESCISVSSILMKNVRKMDWLHFTYLSIKLVKYHECLVNISKMEMSY